MFLKVRVSCDQTCFDNHKKNFQVKEKQLGIHSRKNDGFSLFHLQDNIIIIIIVGNRSQQIKKMLIVVCGALTL